MEIGLMVSALCLGRMVGRWYGMSPAQILKLHSYISKATSEAGAVANYAEGLKKGKYAHLHVENSHHFIPVAVESSTVFGQEARSFFSKLGRRMEIAIG